MTKVQEWDAIGIHRRMHIPFFDGSGRQESGSVVCRPDGVWLLKLKMHYQRFAVVHKKIMEPRKDIKFIFCYA